MCLTKKEEKKKTKQKLNRCGLLYLSRITNMHTHRKKKTKSSNPFLVKVIANVSPLGTVWVPNTTRETSDYSIWRKETTTTSSNKKLFYCWFCVRELLLIGRLTVWNVEKEKKNGINWKRKKRRQRRRRKKNATHENLLINTLENEWTV